MRGFLLILLLLYSTNAIDQFLYIDEDPVKQKSKKNTRINSNRNFDKKTNLSYKNSNNSRKTLRKINGTKNTHTSEPMYSNQSSSNEDSKMLVFEIKGSDSTFFTGTRLKAQLENTVNSARKGSPVLARTLEDEYGNGEIIIPHGSLVIGNIASKPINERVMVRFTRMNISTRKQVQISATAFSADGMPDLSGMHFDAKGKYIAGNLILNFIGAFARGYQDRLIGRNEDYAVSVPGSLKNAAMEGINATAFEEAKRWAHKIKTTEPFVVVPAGTPIIIYLEDNLTI